MIDPVCNYALIGNRIITAYGTKLSTDSMDSSLLLQDTNFHFTIKQQQFFRITDENIFRYTYDRFQKLAKQIEPSNCTTILNLAFSFTLFQLIY